MYPIKDSIVPLKSAIVPLKRLIVPLKSLIVPLKSGVKLFKTLVIALNWVLWKVLIWNRHPPHSKILGSSRPKIVGATSSENFWATFCVLKFFRRKVERVPCTMKTHRVLSLALFHFRLALDNVWFCLILFFKKFFQDCNNFRLSLYI